MACYTIARTASDWDYYFLPQPIRRAIRDELGREPKADAKEAISNKFKTKGDAIMREIQNTISAAKQDIVTNTEPIEITTIQPSANDKFASII